jgi:DNA repair exonuclease SbcCD nuclease subunit
MINKIVHLADIHIRTNQLHDLYKKQIENLVNDIRFQVSLNPIDVTDMYTEPFFHNVRIVLTGDLFHQKINISNEQILLASWFLGELVKIGNVIIIPGNHDFLENNTERIDSITPIVELLNNPNITYFKDSGVYNDDNINWVVYSLYQHNQRPKFTKDEKIHGEKAKNLFVGLFHGPIQGMSTDLGFTFDDAYDRLNFVDLDLLLCGDIHKRQVFKLPGGGDAVMIGSLIQQDFGENIKHHGYGIYDMETKKYIFHDLPNDQPFLHFKINDIKDIETEREQLVNLG